MADLRPLLDPIWRAFALPVTVTLPGGASVETSGVWIFPQTIEAPEGAEARVADPRRTLALRRDEVPEMLRDSRVRAAERDGLPVLDWRVDGFGRIDPETIEVLLVPAPGDDDT